MSLIEKLRGNNLKPIIKKPIGMNVEELSHLLLTRGEPDNKVLVFESNALPCGAEIVSVRQNDFNEIIIEVKEIKED